MHRLWTDGATAKRNVKRGLPLPPSEFSFSRSRRISCLSRKYCYKCGDNGFSCYVCIKTKKWEWDAQSKKILLPEQYQNIRYYKLYCFVMYLCRNVAVGRKHLRNEILKMREEYGVK